MRLVVTEKPSVARDLAAVLGASQRREGFFEGDGLRVTWCVGHLVELEEPAHYDAAWKRWSFDTLPMLPERFALRPRKDGRDQLEVVRKLMRDRAVDDLVNACDAGREGELIFRYVAELVGVRKPVWRLWLASLTDAAIRQAWARLRPARDFDALGDAARSRAEADWLVGLNATRALTCRARDAGGEQLLSVGRVQTPTLAMIVARDRAIESFVPETFWQVHATFSADAGRFVATWFRRADDRGDDGDERRGPPHAERLADETLATWIARAASGAPGRVALARRSRKVETPPLLYDLTELQRRANQRYGMTADRTLEVAQALYERHKLLTYPRTDARYLTPDEVPLLPDIVRAVGSLAPYAGFADAVLARGIRPGPRVVDASEVGDHHAILPTSVRPDPTRLTPDEKRVYDLVARRLLAVLSPDAVFDVTELVVEVAPSSPAPAGVEVPLAFRARGRVCREAGWQAVDPPKKRAEVDLPAVEQGDAATAESAEVKRGETRPPPPHTDASLLKAMETAGKDLDDAELARAMRGAGLGTPATRAAILQTLLQRGFVERKDKALVATDRGRALIDAVPVPELKSAELTGRWERRLTEIAEARADRATFMRDVATHVGDVVAAIRAADPPAPERRGAAGDAVGTCPRCGSDVVERPKVYACSGCDLVVFKTMSRRTISRRLVKQLLDGGRSAVVKGFKSKKGNEFSAALVFQEDGRVGFEFASDREPAPAEALSVEPASADPTGSTCPSCGRGRIVRGRTAFGCDRWREGCDYRRPFPS